MTAAQRKVFFRHFAAACDRQGIPPANREAYRHQLIAGAVPASRGSLVGVGTGADCDKVLRAAAAAAGNFAVAAHFAVAEGARLAKMCEALVWQLWQIEGGLPVPLQSKSKRAAITVADYLRGILAQAGWRWALAADGDDWWLDLAVPHAQKLMMMLDTHRRRTLKRVPHRREIMPDGRVKQMPLTFDVAATYCWVGETLLIERAMAEPHPAVRIRCTS